MKSYSRKVKGVIVSTEIILILSAVIILAFVAMMGLGRTVMNEAISTKATVSISEPQAWYYGSDSNVAHNSFIMVTFYVTNLGDKPVTITSISVVVARYYSTTITYDAEVGKDVNPGETLPISVKATRSRYAYVGMLKQGILIVTYKDANNRYNSVQVPIVITHA
jgi:archaellum component FlaG (FlaF/FlaG flagellin family)